jgi:hypothetical protein
VRRRILAVGAALSAGSLAFGAVAASATSSLVIKTTCKTATGISIAQDTTAVIPGVAKGIEYGPAHCGKVLGSGVQTVAFKVPDSGNRVGDFQTWLATGSLRGKYTLVPQPGTFDSQSFNTTTYTGVMKITGGTGAYQNAKGTATMKCKSIDGIHTTCTNKLKLTQL